ncbi:MAG TPA: hypothetical protein VHJ19_01465 [Gammaproteobacteria bacterium]|nr:hypothetical protein [Gammaproteobacteria bacterium]
MPSVRDRPAWSWQQLQTPPHLGFAAVGQGLGSMDGYSTNRQSAHDGQLIRLQVLAEFTLRYPEHVNRLVLVGLSVDPARRTWSQQLCALL